MVEGGEGGRPVGVAEDGEGERPVAAEEEGAFEGEQEEVRVGTV